MATIQFYQSHKGAGYEIHCVDCGFSRLALIEAAIYFGSGPQPINATGGITKVLFVIFNTVIAHINKKKEN